QKDGNESDLRGDQEARNDDDERSAPASEPELREGISRRKRQSDLQDGDDRSHRDGYGEVAPGGDRIEHLAIRGERRMLRDWRGRSGNDLGKRLERGGDHPRVGRDPEERHDRRDHEPHDARALHARPSLLARQARSWRAARRRRTTKKTTVRALAF